MPEVMDCVFDMLPVPIEVLTEEREIGLLEDAEVVKPLVDAADADPTLEALDVPAILGSY